MMSNIKVNRRILSLSILLVLALVLTACQSTGSAANGSDSSQMGNYAAGVTPAVPMTDSGTEVDVSSKEGLGSFLVDAKGMTLYLYTKDTPGVSNCSDACLEAWPPLLSDGGPQAGEGVTGKLSTIKRDDGTMQVTYDDLPLYYYFKDTQPGDTTGQGVGGVWYVVEP